MADAKFTINGTASSTLGYTTTSGTTITLQLETLPALDSERVVYSVVATSKDAPALSLTPSTGIPATPGGTVTFVMPAGIHSYQIQCQINEGTDASGKVQAAYTFSRMVVTATAVGTRKIVPAESAQFSARGWSDEQNLEIDAMASIVGGTSGVVADYAALSALTGIADGDEITVVKNRTRWRRHGTGFASTLTVDPDLILASADGGRWLRLPGADPSYNYIATFHVDAVAGDNKNSGADASNKVKSIAEVLRRLQGLTLIANATAANGVLVLLYSNVTESVTQDQTLRQWQSAGGFIQFQSAPSAVVVAHAGTFTSVTNWNDATHTVASVTDSALSGAGFSTYVGKVCRIVGGPRNGYEFVIEKDTGSKTCVISQPLLPDFDGTVVNGLQVGDAYEIYTYPKWIPETGTSIEIRGANVDFKELELGDPTAAHSLDFRGGYSLLESCVVHGFDADDNARVDLYNCCTTGGNSNGRVTEGSRATWFGGAFVNCSLTVRTAARAIFYYVDFRGAGVTVESGARADAYWGGGFRVFDCATAVLLQGADAALDLDVNGTAAFLWGTAVTGPQVSVAAGAMASWGSALAPTFTGGGTELSLGGAALTFAAVTSAGGVTTASGARARIIGSTTGAWASGAVPAASGQIRLSNADQINWDSALAAAGQDVAGLKVTSADVVVLGGDTNAVGIEQRVKTGGTWSWIANNVSVLALAATGLFTYAASATVPGIAQTQATAGVGVDTTIRAQQGFAGSVGGKLVLAGGAGGTPGTNLAGDTQIDLGTAVSNASAKVSFLVGGASILDISQPTASVAAIVAAATLRLTSTGGTLRISSNNVQWGTSAGTTVATVASVAAGACSWSGAEDTTWTFTQATRTTDAVTHDLTITSQAPFASATGANRNPGNVVYSVPAPAAGGTAGKHSFLVSATEQARITSAGFVEVAGGIGTIGAIAIKFRKNGTDFANANINGSDAEFANDVTGGANLQLRSSAILKLVGTSHTWGPATGQTCATIALVNGGACSWAAASDTTWTWTQTILAGTGATAGKTLTVTAQQGQAVAAGTNNDGGALDLHSGAVGTGGANGKNGRIGLFLGTTLAFSVIDAGGGNAAAQVEVGLLAFGEANGSITIAQNDATTNTNGANTTIKAQKAKVGGGGTGGILQLRGGARDGAGAQGKVQIQDGAATTRIEVDGTGVGFQGAAPIAKPAAYTITNHTARRTIDETAITLVQLANVVGTLLGDLGVGGAGYGLLQ